MTFTKVLVAEDTDSINFGMVAKLNDMGIKTVDCVQFCEDAYLKIKKAILDREPYQLLISDLSFVNPHRKSKINSGEELIIAGKEIQADLKIIVFSVINKQTTIKTLMANIGVDAYVCKGLNGLKELQNAIETIGENKKFTCPLATAILKQKNVLALNSYEQQLLRLLTNGYKQNEISLHFKAHNITPNSVRSIEVAIGKLKDTFNASTLPQLVHITSQLGLL